MFEVGWAVTRPFADVAGMAGIAGIAGVAGVVVVAGMAGIAGLAGVAGVVWQDVQTVDGVIKEWEAGCAPTLQVPQPGIANALLAKNVGNANADAKTTAFIVLIVPPNGWRFRVPLKFIRATT